MGFPKRLLTFALATVSVFSICSCEKKKPDDTPKENLQNRAAYIEHLNEKYADYKEVEYGLDITKKTDLVGICYSTWFSQILYRQKKDPPNITEILAGNGDWGREGQFHWWGKPALGYYKSDDKEVIRTHMEQIAAANIDYIIIDNTNAQTSWKTINKGAGNTDWSLYVSNPCTAILDTIVEMRAQGKKTPYVVFWSAAGLCADGADRGWGVVDATYDEFLSQDKWKDCFVYWEGKPFMLVTGMPGGAPKADLTMRVQWGLRSNEIRGQWSFLHVENIPMYDTDNYVEQMCVCAAAQESYMSLSTAHGRNHGKFYYEQWKNAFEHRPKAITITWWNEWCAQLLYDDNGIRRFTDNYTQEYSRDIEPMDGGHGDMYYRWTIQYVNAYKNLEDCPKLIEPGFEFLLDD